MLPLTSSASVRLFVVKEFNYIYQIFLTHYLSDTHTHTHTLSHIVQAPRGVCTVSQETRDVVLEIAGIAKVTAKHIVLRHFHQSRGHFFNV